MRRHEVTMQRRGYRVPIQHPLQNLLRSPLRLPVALAVLAALARLPYLHRPLSPDEGGFLMLAGQWSPGSSLYGDYWVDRPPLLIGLFGIAAHLGGAVALRVEGVVAVVLAVVLAGALGHVAAPGRRWAATLTAATAAVLLTTPLFGTREVDGELLAVPLVLAGLLAVLRAAQGARGARACWAVAGLLAVAAMAVKQNMADVAVAGGVALLWQLRSRGPRRTAYDAAAAVAGALLAVGALVVWAEAMGTEPRAMWDAAVRFRFEAAAVISANDPGVTADRLRSLLHALALSGAPVIYLLPLLAVPRARERGCLPWVAAAVCLWEAIGVAAGGSYWWHYLIGLVPGLVLVVAALARHRPALQAPVAAILLYAALVGAEIDRLDPGVTGRLADNERAAGYLSTHARPGDTGVVAYGNPSILAQAGVPSPYPYLWSLPVRVRDPHLTELARVMAGPDRPTWMIVGAGTLDTWAIHPASAQELLDRDYRLVAVVGPWRFFHVAAGHGGDL